MTIHTQASPEASTDARIQIDAFHVDAVHVDAVHVDAVHVDAVHVDAVHVEVVDASDGQPDPMAALAFVSDDAFGGIDLFVGRVRAANHGRAVTGIHYDMFDPLALNIFRRNAEAAIARFGPAAKAYVAHAKGRLKVGDVAVVVAFATPHRDAAFRGCREVIEAVKHEAPIWKQEHYVDGSSEWSEGCALCVEPASEPEPEPAPAIPAMVGTSDCCGCGLGHAGGHP